MAHRNDPDFSPPAKSEDQPKDSLKEKHEKVHKTMQNSGLKMSSSEGPIRGMPYSTFGVTCPHGHKHVISVNHDKGGSVAVFSAQDAEFSDPDPEHDGTMKTAIAYLKKKHEDKGSQLSDESDD